jgi:tail length tape measure protein
VADLGNVAKDSGSGFSALKEIGIGALRELGAAALNLAGTALAAVGGAIKDGIADAQENAKIQAQTAAVLKSTGNAAGKTAEQIADYASSLSDAAGTSLFGDDQIQQSTNLLLTFSEIKGATLDAATAISVDMAQAMGGAPKDAAIQLGKALNDPIKGITALTRVGVVFSDEQKAQIQAMQEAGDTAGAQAVILAELNKEFGGSAAAAAAATGGWSEFNGRMGEAKEALGAAILPLLSQLAGFLITDVMPVIETVAAAFSAWLNDPATQAGLATIVSAIRDGLSMAFAYITTTAIPALLAAWAFIQPALAMTGAFIMGTLIPAIGTLITWFQAQLPVAIAILTAYWNTTLLPIFNALVALWTTSLQPALNALIGWLSVAIPAAVTFLVGVWTTILQPAIAFLAQFIATVLIPTIGLLVNWLMVNIPVAVQTVSDFWNTVLLPALSAVWAFIQMNVIPILMEIATWLQVNVPIAIQTLANFWNTVLLPALNAIWTFIQTYLIPLFTALVQIHMAVLGAALQTLANFWSLTLLPALTKVWDFIKINLGPIVTWLTEMVLKPLMQILADIFFTVIGSVLPALTKLSSLVKDEVTKAFNNLNSMAGAAAGGLSKIGEAVSGVIRWISDLISKLNSVSIPDWLEGHSPPPMADWFSDISGAVGAVNAQLPTLAMNLAAQVGPSGQSITNTASSRSFTYAPQYSGVSASEGPMDLALATSLAGV